MSHDRAAFGTPPWPYSGRGERRPQTARAHRTNSPLELPAALRGRGQTPEGRRWRDLCRHYGSRLGPERLADEATRALLLNLIDLQRWSWSASATCQRHNVRPFTLCCTCRRSSACCCSSWG